MRFWNHFTRWGTRGKKLILEGDGEANIAYYCLHELHILPSQFFALDRQERAFIIAAIDIRIEKEKKEQSKIKKC